MGARDVTEAMLVLSLGFDRIHYVSAGQYL